jgi:hypothetical protein
MNSKEIVQWKLGCNQAREFVIRAGHESGAGYAGGSLKSSKKGTIISHRSNLCLKRLTASIFNSANISVLTVLSKNEFE